MLLETVNIRVWKRSRVIIINLRAQIKLSFLRYSDLFDM